MTCAFRPRSARCRLALRALLPCLALVLAVSLAPAAHARGAGMDPQTLERTLDREMKTQDRQLRSAKAQGRTLDGLTLRYKQRALDENDAIAHFLYGRILGIDEKYDLALTELRRAASLQPGFHQALYREAAIHLMRKDRAAAERPLEEAIRLAPENTTYLLTKAVEILGPKRDIEGVKRIAEAVLRIDPESDAARELLARAYMSLGDHARAQRALTSLIRRNPKAIPLRMQWVQCALKLEHWDEAIGELKTLLAAVPKDPMLQQLLLQAYMGKGDAEAARSLLAARVAENPADWQSRRALVEVLMAKQDFAGAREQAERVLADLPTDVSGEQAQIVKAVRTSTLGLLVFCLESLAQPLRETEGEAPQARAKALHDEILRRIEAVDRLAGQLPLPMLDLAQVTLARLGRHEERIPYLKRVLPLLDQQPEEAKRIAELIELLERGGSEQPSPQNALIALMRRCTAEDPVVRRAGLHEYYELNLPFVDPIIYQRHDPRIEKDALCRLWVVKILGRFENGTADPVIVRIAARYIGLALEDPASMVRRAAAEALGNVGAPAGLLYMIPHLAAMPLEALPTDEGKREDLEREYNAARMALVKLTGRVDYEIGDPTWIALADAKANRAGWTAWLDSPEGVAKRVEGLRDLAEVKDVDPRWQLRYILADVIAVEPPAPPTVALESYRVLRDRIQALPAAKREADPWWRIFPVYPDDALTEAGLGKLRSDLKGWWKTCKTQAK